jgi:hypothetical protein
MTNDDVIILGRAVSNHSVEYLCDDGRRRAVVGVDEYDFVLADGTRLALSDAGLGSFTVSSLRPRPR